MKGGLCAIVAVTISLAAVAGRCEEVEGSKTSAIRICDVVSNGPDQARWVLVSEEDAVELMLLGAHTESAGECPPGPRKAGPPKAEDVGAEGEGPGALAPADGDGRAAADAGSDRRVGTGGEAPQGPVKFTICDHRIGESGWMIDVSAVGRVDVSQHSCD